MFEFLNTWTMFDFVLLVVFTVMAVFCIVMTIIAERQINHNEKIERLSRQNQSVVTSSDYMQDYARSVDADLERKKACEMYLERQARKYCQ